MKNIIIMKKHLFLVAIIGFGVATLCSCGNNSTNTVTGANGEVYNNYQEALNDEDFEAAHKFLSYLYSEYEKTVTENTDFDAIFSSPEEKIKAKAVAYSTAANNVYSGELRFLASSNDSLMWAKCILFLRELPIIGIKYPSQKKLNQSDGTYCFAECYQNYVTLKNSLCNLLLDLAIEKENKEIANKAIQCFVENCKIEDPGVFAIKYVYFDNDDINAAKKKLEESFPETKSKKKRR